ncbi:transposase InsO family protein [Bradyrhizobium sp. USDA 4448]
MDFVHNQLATGGKLQVLMIIDIFSRLSPALEPRLTFRGTDVVEVLERFATKWAPPATIRVDQGSEFVSRDVDFWAYQRGVTLDFSRPGKPTDNAFIEAFNGCYLQPIGRKGSIEARQPRISQPISETCRSRPGQPHRQGRSPR